MPENSFKFKVRIGSTKSGVLPQGFYNFKAKPGNPTYFVPKSKRLVIPAEKEFTLTNVETGNIPLSFSAEHYYGTPWTPGGNDLMYAQKVKWLEDYEKENAWNTERNQQRKRANYMAGYYKARYGDAAAVTPASGDAAFDSRDRNERIRGAFYAPQSVAQMDPVNILMKRWGVESAGYKDGKRDMYLVDRRHFMEEAERRYGKDAEAMDYYYYMLYMYLKGCAYMVELIL